MVDPKIPHGQLERIGLLRHGTAKGRASIAFIIRLDDGTAVIAETTWRLYANSAAILAQSPIAVEEV